MDIRDYLHVNRMTLKEFAEKLGISTNYLGAIKRGEEVPSKMLVKMIALITDGEVCLGSPEELSKNKAKKKKRPRSAAHKSKPTNP